MKFRECPFCGELSGVYLDESPRTDKRLRWTVECVCGASGAPRETEEEATEWWNTRKALAGTGEKPKDETRSGE